MQLLIATSPVNGFKVGDIISVVPDDHEWGAAETMAKWLEAGRLAEDFPTSMFGVIVMPSEPPDVNLMEAHIQADAIGGNEVVDKRLWFFDLDDLNSGQRKQIGSPGGSITVRRSARSSIKNRFDGTSLPLRVESDGNSRHRHATTEARQFMVS